MDVEYDIQKQEQVREVLGEVRHEVLTVIDKTTEKIIISMVAKFRELGLSETDISRMTWNVSGIMGKCVSDIMMDVSRSMHDEAYLSLFYNN